jgi:predicted O-linked N-acetylglucosamine transferase (SPINDLY family)
MAERRFARADCGLPPYAFVYCCFNAAYKITPDMFASWMRILARVKDGVLLLYCDQASAIANLRREAGRNGIDPDRLIFGRRLSRPEYLARYLVADLFLDTLPYNAGATASDALWAGLPVLTRIGDAFAGRIAASLLNSIGLPELITTTSAQYEDLAVALAVNPAQLAELRRRLAANRAAAPLFDTPAFARRLEAAFTIVHERSQAGLPVDHVALADIEDRAAATVQRRA